MLRKIDIVRLAFQLLRPNYSITNGYTDNDNIYHPPVLNRLYKFITCLLYPLKPHIDEWDNSREKAYAIASCQYGRKQVLAILNKYYSNYGTISLETENTASVYLYHPTDTIPIVFYCWKSNSDNTYIYTSQSTWEGDAEYYETTNGSLTADKNQLSEGGTISITSIQSSYTLQNEDNISDLSFLYTEQEQAEPLYLGLEGSFATNNDVIYISQDLKNSDKYNDFIADLNAMLLYGSSVTIKTIQQ